MNRQYGKTAAMNTAAATVIATSRPVARQLPGVPVPIEPALNDDERTAIHTLSLAARQRQLQRLADALGPTPANRAQARAQDNRARAKAKHEATKPKKKRR